MCKRDGNEKDSGTACPGGDKKKTKRWSYLGDKASGGPCGEFIYHGCEGTANNFLNKEECEDICKNHETPIGPGGQLI